MSCSLFMPTRAVTQPQVFFGIGKKSAFLKLVKSDPVMKSCASAFILQNKSQEEISELGKDLMVDLFGGMSNCPYTIITAPYHFHQESDNC